MAYKHRVVQSLSDFIGAYGGGGDNPMMRAIWMGIKSQVPVILKLLDENEEAVAAIEERLRDALGIKDTKGIEEELRGYFKRRNKDGSISIRIPMDSKVGALFPLEEKNAEGSLP